MRLCKSLPFAILPLLLAAIFFLPASQLQAGASNKSGNPYGNGTQFPNGTTYVATFRGPSNMVGIVQFTSASASGTNSGSNSTANNYAIVYANGAEYQGTAFGTVDQSSISCVMALGVTVNEPVYNTNGDLSGYTTITNNTCGGQFTGTTANAYPIQTFTGSGQVGLGTNLSGQNNTLYPISVTGSSLSSGN